MTNLTSAPAAVAAASAKTAVIDADVVIVGCGPTGATLALLLERCGVSSLILEREATIYPLPRAVHFDDHVMRVLQTLGVVDALKPLVRYNPGMRFVDPEGHVLVDWPRPAGMSENGWHSSYRFHQPDLEAVLRNKIAASPKITLKTGVTVTGIEQDTSHAVVSGTHRQQQSTGHYTCHYIVGCDGANSMVQKLIGEQITDFGFNEHWLVIDTLLKKDKPELGDYTIQHCGRHRPATYVRCPGFRRRWEIALKPDEHPADFTREKMIWQLLSDWVTPLEATIERSAVYEFKSCVAKQWRNGRLFIAGDAAHLTPPFMGQGMCAGIRDAANLAWKLGRCLQAQGHHGAFGHNDIHALLNSYQTERDPNVTQYIKTAMSLGRLINSCRSGQANNSASDSGSVEMKSIVPALGTGPGAGLRMAGQWFPQPVLTCGQKLDDLIGYQPVLIVTEALLHSFSGHSPHLCKIVIAETEPALKALLSSHDVEAFVIRPDRYILGGAKTAPEFEALLAAITQTFGQ